jgi:hypothetical protein
MSFPSIAVKAALVSLVLVAAFYLLREHWGHGLGMAPYLLLLACPLLHLFLHGHGNAGRQDHQKQASKAGDPHV